MSETNTSGTTGTFVRVCALADLPEQGAIGVEIGDVPVAVVRVGGEVFALDPDNKGALLWRVAANAGGGRGGYRGRVHPEQRDAQRHVHR